MALWRRLGIGLAAAALALTVLAAVTVLTAQGGDPALYPARQGQPTVSVRIVYDGFHSNLVVPTSELAKHPGAVTAAVARLPPRAFVAIGWGDERYYQERGPMSARWPDFLRALFKPGNRSVLHLATLADPLGDRTHPGLRRIALSPAGFARMQARIDASFVMRNGGPVVVAPGHAPNSLFFASNETFSLLQVCNHWTARMLAAAGVPITPVADTVSAGLEADLDARALARADPAR